MATIILHEPWVRSDKLLNEGWKLRDEGNTLLSESRNLQEEGGELWDEGARHYRSAVKDFFGEDILINWVNGKMEPPNKERAVMPFGELFGYNNLT